MAKENKPKGVQVTIYLEPGLRAALKKAAAEKGPSASRLAEDALRAYLPRIGFPIASGDPTTDAAASEDAVTSSALAAVEKTLADHAAALQAIQEQMASLKAAHAPLDMPEGEFTKVETIILEMVCAGGVKGASAADIKRRLDTMGITFGPRRDALSALHKRKVLRRARDNWVLAGVPGRGGGRGRPRKGDDAVGTS